MAIYGNDEWYKPQVARSEFMLGKLVMARGNTQEGQAHLARAMELREEMLLDDEQTQDQLDIQDFDEHVWYYSR